MSLDELESRLRDENTVGQDLIDCLTSLRLVVPEINPMLHPQLVTLFPPIIKISQSSFSVLRNTAAKCLATLCDVITDSGMKLVVDEVVPLMGDAKRVASRQGAAETIHRESIRRNLRLIEKTLFGSWTSKLYHTYSS